MPSPTAIHTMSSDEICQTSLVAPPKKTKKTKTKTKTRYLIHKKNSLQFHYKMDS
jgi:hypothetical protein